MRKTLLISALAVAGLMMAAAPARADGPELTLRIEPGVAVPLTSPQTDRFNVGGDLALKPTLGLLPWLDANVTLSGLVLPSKLSGIDAGAVFAGGLGLRVKRPHDSSNTGTGFSAVSPWLDVDAQLGGTGPLARGVFSVGGGAAVPTSAARNLWVGPFIRYEHIVESTTNIQNYDTSDARLLIVGLSIEIGPRQSKPPTTPVDGDRDYDGVLDSVDQCPDVPGPAWNHGCPPPKQAQPVPQPMPDPVTVITHIQLKVQFPYDSSVPLSDSAADLQKAAAQMTSKDATISPTIEVDGHASSEGNPQYNQALSVRRAQAVADVLAKAGIPRNRITVKGFGATQPIADNKTEAGRRANRRVEFKCDVTITTVTPGGTK